MEMNRPDLSHVDPEVMAYIVSLENELARYRRGYSRVRSSAPTVEPEPPEPEPQEPLEPDEPPTTITLITATASGIAKRTNRHLYSRQRRGGMGIFDLDAPEGETPAILSLADAGQSLLLITDKARAFRLPLNTVPEAPVRARGDTILGRIPLEPDERVATLLPDQAQGYLALLSQRGMVRLLRHHVFGEYMKPGTLLFDDRTFGPLVAACWTPGDGDLLIATRQGRAIRFAEKLVPPAGCTGIRLTDDDQAAGIAPADDDSGIFLLSEDGRGTIRLMLGFSANKAPGAGGKTAMLTEHLVGCARVGEQDDIFIISRLGKIIRFMASEVPSKEGVVQGVNCMSFRADGVAALLVSPYLP